MAQAAAAKQPHEINEAVERLKNLGFSSYSISMSFGFNADISGMSLVYWIEASNDAHARRKMLSKIMDRIGALAGQEPLDQIKWVNTPRKTLGDKSLKQLMIGEFSDLQIAAQFMDRPVVD